MPQFLPAFHLSAMVWTLVLLSLLLLYLQNVSLPLILGQKLARLQLLFRMTRLSPSLGESRWPNGEATDCNSVE